MNADNKAVVGRLFAALDANTDPSWAILDELVGEDFVSHTPPLPGLTPDRAGLKQAAEIFRVAVPGTHEILMQVAEDDLVVTHAVGRGVHAGELLGIPASNRPVEAAGIAIYRVRDGKVVEYWGLTDVARILQQIGALPAG
jgi:predicted ester cyclase